ncbi:lipoyl(octanoyl) transferase LipB [Glaciihabitans sp. INWT7]|uniref:lipoyl(octanoyl) transferase LipB n=1 Tax=Glaciihabitans sp. INWT7 TaxID=2596912 RepID=UPI0016240BDC|nr:lipoyl(octanoyl) transferase LipB [Glaciihabitans sp. INWT7]QNE47402.1 lipoyl(octanoyl) transferase LipB [Glaciihabitans sp. INWT7]
MVDIVVAGLAPDLLPYPDALTLQRSIHSAVVEGIRPDTVVLLEHPSVYTAGTRTEASERPDDGSPVIDVDRGGKITWHGPGQLVGYPILRLHDPVDVVAYVRRLEELLIDVIAHFGVTGVRVAGRSGVWIIDGAREEKIAAIGIRVAGGVTMHGFALNCSNSLDAYAHIVACGIRDAGVTTISRELGREITPEDAAQVVAERFDALVAEAVAVSA